MATTITSSQWRPVGRVLSCKGSSSRSALESSTKMKVRLKAGNEKLGADISRWFAGFNTYDYLYNIGIEAELEIDNKKVTLTPNEDETEKEILYNNVKTEMDYAEGTNSEENNTITIGFIEYAKNVIIMSNYSTANFSMTLISIQSPAAKTKAKTEEDGAKQILNALTPKGAVPLKKMEAGKFAKVKSKYPLLATIENFDATKGGTIKKPITETYDYRNGTNSPNPPSLIDCFTADLKIIYDQRNNFGITDIETVTAKGLPSAAAKKLMDVYLNKDYNNIPGYRPWNNWSFVRGLTEGQRTQLATELQGYISEYGFSE